jgi:hypothetical protein
MLVTATELDQNLFVEYTLVRILIPVRGQIKGEVVRQSLDGHSQKSFQHGIFGHQHSSAVPKLKTMNSKVVVS